MNKLLESNSTGRSHISKNSSAISFKACVNSENWEMERVRSQLLYHRLA
ncbi:hypothetical protein ACE1CI_02695 [Aerosakkonemataceae cyanobacterium BLCC-F50]|uniref:Uncharacterized protein n=1 Tax=Floridaenema flaviceps BLCC-F50 TaxID=3153642 RepID=A0ABV4XJG0_9CYAN